MSAPVIERITRNGQPYGWSFYCPGCQHDHPLPVEGPNGWGFNGSETAPTFTPSVLVRAPYPDGMRVCHSFVTDGRIQFLTDSMHHLSGQTVPLTPRPADTEFTP